MDRLSRVNEREADLKSVGGEECFDEDVLLPPRARCKGPDC